MTEPVPVVDIHAHLVPKGWPDLAALCGGSGWPWLRIDSEREAMLMVGQTEFRPVGPQAWDPRVRLADLDADGVELQVVSPTPVFFSYDNGRPGGQGGADLQRPDPGARTRGRLLPFCQVPLTRMTPARAGPVSAAGHVGVEIATTWGAGPDDAGIVTFLQHCAEVGARCSSTPGTCPAGLG